MESATHAKITTDIDLLRALHTTRHDSIVQIQTIEFEIYDTERDKVKAKGKVTTETKAGTDIVASDSINADVIEDAVVEQEIDEEIETTETTIPYKGWIVFAVLFILSMFFTKKLIKQF